MMLDYLLEPQITRAHYFKVQFMPQGYGCVDERSRLRPVPPGTTRRELYCGQCQAQRCLLPHGSPPVADREEAEEPIQWSSEDDISNARKNSKRMMAYWRARGCGTSGKALKRSCWNCVELRVKSGGYVCRFEPEAEPVSAKYLNHRSHRGIAEGCEHFNLRLVVEIPAVEE